MEYKIDFSDAKSAVGVHETLMKNLGFPSYYGLNTDALWDCLTDFTGETVTVDWPW